eukprot:g7671.t1
MLQNGVPAVYRKPSWRSERRQGVSRVKAGGMPPPPAKDEEGGGANSNGELRGVLEIEPAEKDKDTGPASALLGRRQSPTKGGGEAYRLLYVCACAVAFVNAMTFSVLGPFLPAYIEGRFGSTVAQVGMIMAAYPAVNLATSPLVGWIMNRYGRWNSLLAGLVILTVATSLYGLASSVMGLYVASGLHGASLSFIHVSSLGLLSVFPNRLTESMAGIEIWSGVAAIVGPPLGCLVVPHGGVSSIFLMVALAPVCLLFCAPRVGHLVRAGKDEGDYGEVGQSGGGASSLWKVARSRGVLAGAFVTAYNYGVIGFLEVTLAPHLAQTLSTSPRSIGFVLVLPNILFTVTAMKAEDIVDRHGVRRTLLGGLCIMTISLVMCGPSPALAPALVTRGAARGMIGAGLLTFQVGSSLASVPAFTAMQGGVAGMGTGADDMVASAHAMSIGVGEIIGPLVGGYFVELLPTSPAFACEPGVPIVKLHDPIFQLAGELRPHQPDSQDEGPDSQEGTPFPPPEAGLAKASDGQGGDLDNLEDWQGNEAVASGVGAEGENARRTLGEDTRRIGKKDPATMAAERDEAWTAAAGRRGRGGKETRESMAAIWPLGRGFLLLAGEEEEEEEEEEGREHRHPSVSIRPLPPTSPEGKLAIAGGEDRGARDGGEAGEQDHHHYQQQQPHRARRLLERKNRKARLRRAKRRPQNIELGPAEDAMMEPPALDAAGAGAGAGAGAVVGDAGAEEKAIDLPSPAEVGEDLARAAVGDPVGGEWVAFDSGGAAASDAVVGDALVPEGGGGQDVGGDGGGDEQSCNSAFPLATTMLAWASVFAIAAMYWWLPHQSGSASKVHGGAGLQ